LGKPDDALKVVAKLYQKIGWHKRLCDLTEQEVLAIIVVTQSLKDINDEYLDEYLAEVYREFRPERDEDGGIPF